VTENQMGGVRTAARDEGFEVAQHTREAASQVGSTVREQASQVTQETAAQARHVVRDVRERVAAEAEEQAQRVSRQLGRIADELGEMAGNAPSDSMSAGAIQSAADTSRQAARFLDERGAQGLLDSARDYARRKPGTFLLGAAVAGFLVGRVAKSATGGDGEGSRQQGGGAVPVTAERTDVPADYGTPLTPSASPGVPVAAERAGAPTDYGAPLTPSASPGAPAAGVPHVEP
jgi:hypothetical protein